MKKLFLLFLFFSLKLAAQQNLENILVAGVEDANRFIDSYIGPVAEGMIYNSSNGWIQEAQVKKPLRFDISVVANASLIKDHQKYFILNTEDYEMLKFKDGSISKKVGTAFGENNPEITVMAEVINDNGETETVEFYLPQGLASTNINVLPTAFIHGRVGLFKATELKVRYLPTVKMEDVRLGIFGIGVQHEFSKWFSSNFPLAISGLIVYNNMKGSYKFYDDQIIEAVDPEFELKQNSMLYQLQVSTKFKKFNFYGGLGFLNGTSNFNVLGSYEVKSGSTIADSKKYYYNPISLKHKVSGFKGTLGAKLQLGFFKLHADYNFSEFNTVSVGMHFGT